MGRARKPLRVVCVEPNPLLHVNMASRFSLSAALSMLDIPMPEDDDMSDDEFDGYIDGEYDGAGEGSNESEDDPIVARTDAGPSIPTFVQPVGCAQDMTDASPLQFFQQLVTNEMLEHVVEQTNLYAQQYIDNTDLPPHSRVHGWKRAPHDLAELKKFLAMTITMGLVSYPELEDYWSTSWPFATPAFSKVSFSLSPFSLPPPSLSLTRSHTHIDVQMYVT